jgi:hypothetical protein
MGVFCGFSVVRTWGVAGENVVDCRMFCGDEKHANFLK